MRLTKVGCRPSQVTGNIWPHIRSGSGFELGMDPWIGQAPPRSRRRPAQNLSLRWCMILGVAQTIGLNATAGSFLAPVDLAFDIMAELDPGPLQR